MFDAAHGGLCLYRLETECTAFTRWLPELQARALRLAGYRVTRLSGDRSPAEDPGGHTDTPSLRRP
jgi:hypothetical protein